MNRLDVVYESHGRMYIIDYLKGFSIFTIVLMHLMQDYITSIPNIVSKLASIGGTGVHIFFVCSGFGLYLSYLNKNYSFKAFIKKRFIKIYIPYVIVVLISFSLPWMYFFEDKFVALLSHIFLFKMIIEKYECSFGGHFWFVSTMIQFYLFYMALCKIKSKVGSCKNFLIICTTISVLWWFFIYIFELGGIRVWSSFFLQYLWEFALGMCLAKYVKDGKKISLNKYFLVVCAIVGIGIQAFMAMRGNGLEIFNDIPALVGYGSLAILFYNIPIIKKIGIKLSTISYEWYLIHILVFSSIFNFISAESLLQQCIWGVLAFGISICLSFVYSYFLKKTIYRIR